VALPISLRPRRRPGHPYLAGAPLLIAHRGGSKLAPENTLLAFQRAHAWWQADILELDVHATADGHVVVLHDPTVDRTTDGTGPIAALTLAEAQALDAGYRFTPDGGKTFPFRGRGVHIPTLVEVLAAIPGARVNVELKAGEAAAGARQAIADAGATDRCLLASARLAYRMAFGPYGGATSASREEGMQFYLMHRAHCAAIYDPPVDAFQIPEKNQGRQILSPRFIADAHRHGMAVHVWTVDEESDMRRLLAWGADGLISDRPDRLARVLHDVAGRPLPPGPPEGEAEPFMEWLLRT
jgi:glycerophosphoryl diester phosphodiesterase